MDYEKLIQQSDDKEASGKKELAQQILSGGLAYAEKQGEEAYAYLLRAELACLNDKFAEALKLAKEANKLEPDNDLILRCMGIYLGFLGRYVEAIPYFDKALEIKPNSYQALRSKGGALSWLGRNEDAITYFDQALKIKPDDYGSLHYKGVALSYLGREEEAISYFDKALKINPNDYQALRKKGVALVRLGHAEDAITYFDQALKINANDYNSLRDKGSALSKLYRDGEALFWLDQALQINPSDFGSLRDKGSALSKLNRDEEALFCLDQLLRTKSNNYQSFYAKGKSLSYFGRETEAISYFDKALKINPHDYRTLRNKGASLFKLRQVEEAKELLDKALTIAPNDIRSLYWRGMCAEALNDKQGALNYYEKFKEVAHSPLDKDWLWLIESKIACLKPKLNLPTGSPGRKILHEILNALDPDKREIIRAAKEDLAEFTSDNKSILSKKFCSFISILRKWNSYTPVFPSKEGNNLGGGYFLFHKGKGIVIDPGFNFVENFYSEGFKIADIDAVLITHAHNDHTVDLESILSLIHKLNSTRTSARRRKKKIDLLINTGTFMKYSGWLSLKDKEAKNYVKSITVLQPGMTYIYGGLKIHATNAKHNEIVSSKYCIGCIIEATGRNGFKLGMTGDTGWEHDGSIAKQFKAHEPNLMIVHLGTIKDEEFDYVKATTPEGRLACHDENHLGILGVTNLLDDVRPKLAVISEFGEELRDVRTDIAEALTKTLRIQCLPGDIGLHIRLCDLAVACCVEKKFVLAKDIAVNSVTGNDSSLIYHKDQKATIKLSKALAEREAWRKMPMEKKVTNP